MKRQLKIDVSCLYLNISSTKKSTKLLTWLVLLISCVLLSPTLTMAGESARLTPISMKMLRGTSSDQGVAVLGVQELQGYTDHWPAYIEYYPTTGGLYSRLSFEAPEQFVNSDIDSLEVTVNFRGAEKSEQWWRWHIRNYRSNRWERIGDNANVSDWRWTTLRFTVPGNASDYFDALGRTAMIYSSPSSHDNSNVDSVAISITLADAEPIEKPPVEQGGIWRPKPGTSWQWQISGPIDTSFDVEMYDIDLFDAPQSTINALKNRNIAVVCYFSAGSFENWRPDAGSFPNRVKGRDNGWPGENWLDIRAIDVLGPIMAARLDLAVSKGCDAVEPDNIDGYTNQSGFALTGQDQINYNKWLANAAHARGLSIGLKNDLEQVAALEPYFDWALNEQCVQYNECDRLTPFVNAGKAVFGVEYNGDPGRICSITNALNFDFLIKQLDLGAARQSCR